MNPGTNEVWEMESSEPISQQTRERLRLVRTALIRLHKVLLGFQRQAWEKEGGRIGNSYEFLNIVMHDAAFAWLHRLSELIVQIDELLDSREEVRENNALGLIEQAKFLLVPAEFGDDFQTRYFTALQESPDVVLAHSEVVPLFGKRNDRVH
ncbi:MAG TPA: hypothetical protein VIB00_12365 [Pyrinomonadaceae bacterium]|jgi:hypothetical protein